MSDNVRRDNRRALPKYLLTILLFGLLGGVLGFFTGVAGAAGVAETVRQALDRVLAVCAPWGIVGSAVVGRLMKGQFNEAMALVRAMREALDATYRAQ